MKIESLKVDGYGVWSGLKLDRLDEGLNVFCGPNEAGKTTLMQFMRSMFFGFSSDRRRYLPPVHGGRPGGQIELANAEGRFRLSRHDDDEAPGPKGSAVVAAADGTRHGEPFVGTLLSGVDEPTFNHVFAVGLREIQELGTLGDLEAAALLFRLSAGLDRVSLVDVMRELDVSRRRLLEEDGRSGRIGELLAQRDRLRGDVASLDSLGAQYAQLGSQRDALDREVAELEASRGRLEHDARVLETAISVRGTWNERAAVDARLTAMNLPGVAPEDAFERFERTESRLKRLRKQVRRVEHRRRQIRRRVSAIKINDALGRQAARIEAFREQEGWMTTLRAKVAELENENRQLGEQLASRRAALGLDEGQRDALPKQVGRRASAELRRAGRALRQRRAARDEARARLDRQAESSRAADVELRSAMASRGAGALAEAIDSSGNLAAQLRRRIALDERIEQLRRYQTEMETQIRNLLARQVLPLGTVIGLGVVCVFCVVMLMAGLFIPSGLIGAWRWPLSILGIAGVVVTLGMKIMLEKANTRRLDACQKQINMVQLQTQEAERERESLDESLPAAGGSRAAQLEGVEKDLAELEALMPLDARRRAAEHEATTAELQLQQADDELKAAKRQWRETLRAAGLPEGLLPKQVRDLLRHRETWAGLIRRSEQVESELHLRQQEFDRISDRATHLATEAGVAVNSGNPVELLHQLTEALRQEETRIHQRKELRQRAARLRRRRAKLLAAMRPLRRRRRQLLDRLGVRDADELRQKREVFEEAARLRRQRASLASEIETSLGAQCTEQELAAQLADASEDDLASRWEALEGQLEAARTRHAECLERRGQIKSQLADLAKDRRPAEKRLELGLVEQRLAAAVRRWQVLAVTAQVLRTVKEFFERQRQPETLREASEYLRRLTAGRYIRVWTPLGEDVLRVDDARGTVLPVEVLSQGTREQLFLALRLALVACYARRGIDLPLVLDDVLVNFDTPRAKAAASLLRDFAREGHQLLVFTCHDHILSLFKSLKVDARRLPNQRETAEPKKLAKPKPEKRKKRRRRQKVVEVYDEEESPAWEEEAVVDEPDDETDDDLEEEELDEEEGHFDEEEDELDEDDEDELDEEEEEFDEEEDEEEWEEELDEEEGGNKNIDDAA